MTVDDSSSQDAKLIDDDLVAALGFEPVRTIEPGDDAEGSTESSNGDGAEHSVAVDEPGHDNGSVNGFGVDTFTDEPDTREPDTDGTTADDGAQDDLVIIDDAENQVVEPPVEDELVDHTVDADETWGEPMTGDTALDETAEDDTAAEEIGLETAAEQIAVDEPEAPAVDDVESSTAGAVIDLDELDGESHDALEETALEETALDDTDDGDGADPGDLGFLDLAEADDVFADAGRDDEVVDDAGDLAVGERIDSDVSEHLISAPTLDAPTVDGPIVSDTAPTGEAAVVAEPVVAAQPVRRRRKRRIRARKSRRVIRHIDPWSVLTFSVLFHMVVFASLLLSSVLVWNAAIASGMVENVESFIQELGDYETFEINADVMFRAAIVIAGMLTLASSVMVVLLTVVFNLISDLVGGIRVTVIEEETVRVPIDRKRSADDESE